MTTIALPQHIFAELTEWLDLDVETAAVVLMRPGNDGRILLARSLHPIPDSSYHSRSATRMDIASTGYVPTLNLAAARGEIACFVHTHPRADPSPSQFDDEVDNELRRFFPDRIGRVPYVSLIVGGTREAPHLDARVYADSLPPRTISRFRVVGQRLRLMPATTGESSETFDRQVRAFGDAGQAVLGALRVGVVGAGGTGSAVVEQLTRLGVGKIVIADDDVVSSTNVTRIHESSAADVGEPKVTVAGRLAGRIPAAVQADIVVGRVTDEQVARRFVGCDAIFGCTDDHAGRAVLSRIAYWYLIPVIDMGVVIDSSQGRLRGIYGRVTTIGPDYPCLLCRDVVDPIRMRDEQLSPEEHEIRLAEGYAPELDEPDPSVVTYTTLVASLAVSELLSRLFGIGDGPGELLLRIHDRKLGARAGSPRQGHYCSNPEHWGRGDEAPFLGQTW